MKNVFNSFFRIKEFFEKNQLQKISWKQLILLYGVIASLNHYLIVVRNSGEWLRSSVWISTVLMIIFMGGEVLISAFVYYAIIRIVFSRWIGKITDILKINIYCSIFYLVANICIYQLLFIYMSTYNNFPIKMLYLLVEFWKAGMTLGWLIYHKKAERAKSIISCITYSVIMIVLPLGIRLYLMK